MNYLPHQQRVVDEAIELGARIESLKTFIGSSAFREISSHVDRDLLVRQARQMTDYCVTLHERMARWNFL